MNATPDLDKNVFIWNGKTRSPAPEGAEEEKTRRDRLRGLAAILSAVLVLWGSLAAFTMWVINTRAAPAQQQTLMEPPRRILPAETPTPIATPATPLAYAKEQTLSEFDQRATAATTAPVVTPMPAPIVRQLNRWFDQRATAAAAPPAVTPMPAPIIRQPHRWLHQVHRRHHEPSTEDAETRQLNREQIR
jgi:hypothetical protein